MSAKPFFPFLLGPFPFCWIGNESFFPSFSREVLQAWGNKKKDTYLGDPTLGNTRPK